MKIGIVCGHFVPEMGYVEVHLAKVLSKTHQVRVFTSDKIPAYVKPVASATYSPGLTKEGNHEVCRLKSIFSIGQVVISGGLRKKVEQYSPDMVIVIGVGKVFPKPVFKINGKKNIPVHTLYGDNEDTYDKLSPFKATIHRLIRKYLKRPSYELSLSKSRKLFYYTPSTRSELHKLVRPFYYRYLDEKSEAISLGFDHQQFYFDARERIRQREELNITEKQRVFITITRLTPAKNIETVISSMKAFKKHDPDFRYLLIGSLQDQYSELIKQKIRDDDLENNIILLPFQSYGAMRAYYNAADCGIWTHTAITVFEAFGTGLPLILPDKRNLEHVSRQNFALNYSSSGELISLLKNTEAGEVAFRAEKSENAKAVFSWKAIAEKITADGVIK